MSDGSAGAPGAQAGLEASKNVWVLSNAAYMLQSQYNLALQRGAPNPRAAFADQPQQIAEGWLRLFPAESETANEKSRDAYE